MHLAKPNQEDNSIFSALLQLEADARNSESQLALHYFIVNETRRLIRYRYALLLERTQSKFSRYKAIKVSGVTTLDRTVPKIHYVERVVDHLAHTNLSVDPVSVSDNQLPQELKQDCSSLILPFAICVNLVLPNGKVMGTLWFEREIAWSAEELLLIKRLASTYAHAWGYFKQNHSLNAWFVGQKKIGVSVLLLGFFLFIPIQHSTLGLVKVVAKDPIVVAAPMDGVIASIPIEPNQIVSQGETLFQFEDTNFRNEYIVAEQALVVSQAELKKVTQSAFQDEKSKAEIALSKAKVDLAVIKRNYAKEMLDYLHVVAEKQGMALFNNKLEMIGRPVKVGERLMEIAEVGKLKFRIELPVENNIAFSVGAPVKVYLDINPLQSIDATITSISFRAETLPGDMLAYRIEAESTEDIRHLRIGWQGTAKIYGNTVSLFFYLFRRPLATVRQYVGL